MKRFVSILICTAITAMMIPTFTASASGNVWDGSVASGFSEGLGTEDNPYIIDEGAQLAYIARQTNAAAGEAYTGIYFKIVNDIDLNSCEWTPIGDKDSGFNGVIDGGGHVIRNLKISKASYAIGFIGRSGMSAQLRNLGFENTNISYRNKPDDPANGEYRACGTGGVIGIVGGGTYENCYIRDSVVENLNEGTSEETLGGFAGKGECIFYDKSGSMGNTVASRAVATFRNCYVTHTRVMGSANAVQSGFIGSYRRWTDNPMRIRFIIERCYTADIEYSGDLSNHTFYGFMNYDWSSDHSNHISMSNCYTTMENGGAKYVKQAYDAEHVSADVLIEKIADGVSFAIDNPIDNINHGYPVLINEAGGWIKGTDTDILHKNAMNQITNGQSYDYLFNDINLVNTVQIGEKHYSIGWTTKNGMVITKEGNVLHNKKKMSVDMEALIYCNEDDAFYNEAFTFGVTERGALIAYEDFDDMEEGASLEGAQNGDGVFYIAAGEYENDMAAVTEGNGGEGIWDMKAPQTYSDKTIGIKLRFMLSSGCEALKIKTDDTNELIITPNEISYGGASASTEIKENTWNTVSIRMDQIAGRSSVELNGNEVINKAAAPSEFDGISILEASGKAYIDKILIYELIPDELDGLTYDMLLNGQSRFLVNENINLPRQIAFRDGKKDVMWESSNPEIVSVCGDVAKVDITKKVVLTASVTDDKTGEIAQAKDFELYIAPKGSSLIYAEDFEDAAEEGQYVDTYGGWTRSATNAWTDYTIEKAPDEPSGKLFEEVNKSLLINRKKIYTSEEEAPPEHLRRDLDIDPNWSVLEFNFDMYYTSLSSRPLFRLMYKTTPITEMYFQGTTGYFSNTVSSDNKVWFNWLSTAAGKWTNYRIVMDKVKKTFEVWCDGVYCNKVVTYTMDTDMVHAINFGSQRHHDPALPWYVDNVVVRNLMPSNEDAVKYAADDIELDSEITADMTLPTSGSFDTLIYWESSDTEAVSPGGIVNDSYSGSVTLTAHICKGAAEFEKTFNVNINSGAVISASKEALEQIAHRFTFDNIFDGSRFYVDKDLNLIDEYNKGDAARIGGVKIKWISDNTEVISNEGVVTQGESDCIVNLTAKMTAKKNPFLSVEKKFKLYVPQAHCVRAETEDFDKYDEQLAGKSINGIGTWTVGKPVTGVETVSSKLYRDGYDSSNKLLAVNRYAFNNASDEPAVLNVSMKSSDIMLSVMFKMESESGVINMNVGGIDQNITIGKNKIKIGNESFDASIKVNEWMKLSIYYDGISSAYDVFLEHEKINSKPIHFDPKLEIKNITFLNKASDKSSGVWYIDDICIRDISVSDEEAVSYAIDELNIDNDVIEWDIEDLPNSGKYGTVITWSSSDENVLESNGTVKRKIGADTDIVFTATVSRNGVSDTKVFNLKVPGLTGNETPTQDIFDKHAEGLGFELLSDEDSTRITKKLNLIKEYNEGNTAFYGGMDIEWSSDVPHVVDSDGNVIQQIFDVAVTLTATCTSKRNPSIKKSITYPIIVWADAEVVHWLDFEDIPEDYEGKKAVDMDSAHFETELRSEEKQGETVTYQKDYIDRNEPWEKANKAIYINRYKYNTPNEEILPERTKYYFENPFTPPNDLIVSFRYMLGTENTRADIELIGVSENNHYIIKPNNFEEKYPIPTMKPGEWHTYTFVLMQSSGIIKIMLDGKEIHSGYLNYIQKGDFLGVQVDISRNSGLGAYYFDDFIVRKLADTDEKAVDAAMNEIDLKDGYIADKDLDLKYMGACRTNISYESSKPMILSNSGVVARGQEDENVELTAYVRRGGCVKSKTFNITIKAAEAQNDFEVRIPHDAGRKLTSIDVNSKGTVENATLIAALYNQDRLEAVRTVDISHMAAGARSIPIEELNYNDYEFYRIEAYVQSGSRCVSNKAYIYH